MKLSRVILAALATLMLFVAGAMAVSADPPTPEATKTKPQVQPAAPNEKSDQSTYQEVEPNAAPTATGPLAISVQSASGAAQTVFTVGETQRICYNVPGPGYIQIVATPSAPGYYSRTIVYGWDYGNGGCFTATVGYPTGTRTLTIYRWDPVTGVRSDVSTTFTVNPPAPQSNVIVRGQVQSVAPNQITVKVTQLLGGVWIPGVGNPTVTYTVVTGGTPGTCTQVNGTPVAGSYVEIRGQYTSPYNIAVCGVQGSYVTVLQPTTQGSGQVYVNRGCGSTYPTYAPIYIYLQIAQAGNYTLTNMGANTGNTESVMWQGYLTPGLWVIGGQVGPQPGLRTLKLYAGLTPTGTALSQCQYTGGGSISVPASQGKSQTNGGAAADAQADKAQDAKRPEAKPIDVKGEGW